MTAIADVFFVTPVCRSRDVAIGGSHEKKFLIERKACDGAEPGETSNAIRARLSIRPSESADLADASSSRRDRDSRPAFPDRHNRSHGFFTRGDRITVAFHATRSNELTEGRLGTA